MKKYTLVLKDGCTVEVKAKCLKDALEKSGVLTSKVDVVLENKGGSFIFIGSIEKGGI